MLKWIDLPPVWLAAGLTVIYGFDALMPWGIFGPVGARIGIVLALAGVSLMLAAVVQMVLARTSFVPRRDPNTLVTSGVFALSRNPIYLGDAMVLMGAILWWDVPVAVPLVPCFMWMIQHRFIYDEEARLRGGFAGEFKAWAKKTRRWL